LRTDGDLSSVDEAHLVVAVDETRRVDVANVLGDLEPIGRRQQFQTGFFLGSIGGTLIDGVREIKAPRRAVPVA